MNKVIIFEKELVGHHSIYLYQSVKAYVDAGFEVDVVLPEKLRGDALVDSIGLLGMKGCRVLFFPLREKGGLILREFHFYLYYYNALKSLKKSGKVDLVFLPYLDYFFYAFLLLGAVFKVPVRGIAMRPLFHLPLLGIESGKQSMGGVKKWLFNMFVGKRFEKLYVVDKLLELYSHQSIPDNTNTVEYLAEPCEFQEKFDTDESKESLGLLDYFVILIYGAIDERKGIQELLSALSEENNFENVAVVCAGRHSSNVKSHLYEFSKCKVLSFDEYVDDDLEQLLFSAASVVWLGYKNHYGSSGVLVQAASYRVPVVGCFQGVVGHNIREYNLGAVVDVNDKKSVVSAIQQYNSNESFFSAESSEFTSHRSWSEFRKQLVLG